jgi:hypothetical protein
MKALPDSTPTRYLSKLRAATSSWFSQIVFYLALLIVFFVIDQLVVADVYRHYFHSSGSIFNWLFLTGDWMPALANAIVIAVAVRARTFLAYLIPAAVLTCILSVVYYHMAGLGAIYSHDPMLGSAGIVYLWLFDWFCGGIIGFVINLMVKR